MDHGAVKRPRLFRFGGVQNLTLRSEHFPLAENWPLAYSAATDSGPFVYRLGHQVFNLVRGVRLPYGLPQIPALFT